jgi:hypothetical protein
MIYRDLRRIPASNELMLSAQGRQWWWAMEGSSADNHQYYLSDRGPDMVRDGDFYAVRIYFPFILPIKGAG